MTDTNREGSASRSSSLRSWLAVSSVAVGTFGLVTTEFLPIGLLTTIARDLGITDGQAGLLVTMPALVAAVAAPSLLLLAGKLDRKVALLILSGLLVATNALASVAPNLVTILFARFLLGMAVGGFWSIAASVGVRLVPEEQGAKATSLILAGVSLGTILGVPAGSMIGELWGWRAAFVTAGVLGALVFIAQFVFLPRLPTSHAIVFSDLIAPFKDPVARLGIIASIFMAVGQFSTYTYMEPFLRHVSAFGPNLIAAALVGYGVLGLLGNVLGGMVVSKSVRAGMMGTSALLGTTMLLMPTIGSSQIGAGILVLVWGLAFGALPVSVQTWTLKASPETPEAAMAVIVFVFQIALASGAFVGGSVVDGLGVSSVMYLGGALMVLAVAALTVNRKSPDNAVALAAGTAAQ